MKKEEIEKAAIDSYQTYFHDQEAEMQNDDLGEDVILNKDKLTQEINEKKENVKKRHESLEVLREKVTLEAEESLESVFKENKKENNTHKMNTEEMYEELNKEKTHLTDIANELKEKQMKKKKL